MIKLPEAKETKFVYHGGNGAFDCGYESGWNAAISEVQRLNATAQPKCQKCGDTGMADSGGTLPWGEPILIECDCATAQPVSDGCKVPEGWKLVPIEPTTQMYEAGDRQLTTKQVWDSMLAAAPGGQDD